ncbi:hypothetical protein GCM10010270_12790 [Streptomyces violaceus]|nr:hypothetical protein GCM10010270_12790 [Streptomyces janthinus]
MTELLKGAGPGGRGTGERCRTEKCLTAHSSSPATLSRDGMFFPKWPLLAADEGSPGPEPVSRRDGEPVPGSVRVRYRRGARITDRGVNSF